MMFVATMKPIAIVAIPSSGKRCRIDGSGLLANQRMPVDCGSIGSAALLHRPPAFSE
jgi:hypothetical protein